MASRIEVFKRFTLVNYLYELWGFILGSCSDAMCRVEFAATPTNSREQK